MTKIEMIERKQEQEANKHMIVDQRYIAMKNAESVAKEAQSSKKLTWVSVLAAIVGTVAAVIALFH